MLNQNDDEEEEYNEEFHPMKILYIFDHEEYNRENSKINYSMNWLVMKAYRRDDDRQMNDHQVKDPIGIDKELSAEHGILNNYEIRFYLKWWVEYLGYVLREWVTVIENLLMTTSLFECIDI